MADLETKPNRLFVEKSPYLLQHANNPVNWYPWSDEAFAAAEKENKPIFLSIGYSTCHWCHVMAHESFEDPVVAALMNDTFINIKVDREERPDIDKVYMQVAQMMTGGGGWPLTIIMTPDKKPFYAATYIPRESRYGMLGMLELVPKLKEIWETDRDNIVEVVGQVERAFRESTAAGVAGDLQVDAIDTAFSMLSQRYDEKRGGFGNAPKFPSPHNLMLLLRYWRRNGDDWALKMVETTLKEMRKGGLFDHIGYGFHRYSTDANWLVPHFEKMVYDQAMLVLAYLEAYQATGNPFYSSVAREIVGYVFRSLTDENGAFYSAEDADSEGVEGKFYVWSYQEISGILDSQEANAFRHMFNLLPEGNFREEATNEETGLNIPHVTRTRAEIAHEMNITVDKLDELLQRAQTKLFEARSNRVKPHLDDKILTDWNGLFIAALARAARVLNEPHYKDAAVRAISFIMAKMRPERGILFHRYRDGEAAVSAFLDDYAYLIWALVEMYETAFDPNYLELALELSEEQIEKFWDSKQGGFYFTSKDAEKLIARQRDAYDGALPSGNSVAMHNMIRLARLLGDSRLEDVGKKTGDFFSRDVSRNPAAYSFMLSALDLAVGPSLEVVIAGDPNDESTKAMLDALRCEYRPNMVVLLRSGGEVSRSLNTLAPFTKYYNVVGETATAHVCIDHSCKLPTNDVEHMIRMIDGENRTSLGDSL
ncbi:MAG: thioredoxin domain-containing protein [Promethearchaeota archaeon]